MHIAIIAFSGIYCSDHEDVESVDNNESRHVKEKEENVGNEDNIKEDTDLHNSANSDRMQKHKPMKV